MTAAAVALVATFVTAGCGNDAENGDGGSTPAAPGADVVPCDDPAQLDLDANITTATVVAPQGLDPHRSPLAFNNSYLTPIYDSLVREDPAGELVPGLATEWRVVDDSAALQLTLREGVTFHDGAAFDAEVVRANIERAKTLEGSAIASLLDPVESVEVVDPLTVRLHLTEPSVQLPRVLADRPGMMISPNALDDPDLANRPVGAGPFRLAELRPGDLVSYERFADYWDPDAIQYTGLEILVQPDPSTRLNALSAGELDVAQLDPSVAASAESAGLVVSRFDSVFGFFLQLNRTRSEFGDVRVRQAMNYAVDREGIVEAVFAGVATPAEQFFGPAFPSGHVPEMVGRYPYDPEEARRLLAEAGLADGFAFEVLVPAFPAFEQAAEAVQAQFAEVGITMSLRTTEPGAATDIFQVQQNGDALFTTWAGVVDPMLLVDQYFTSDALTNPGGHVPDGMAEAYDAALQDQDEIAARTRELMELAVEEAGNVIIDQGIHVVAAQHDVCGIQVLPLGGVDFRGLGVLAG